MRVVQTKFPDFGRNDDAYEGSEALRCEHAGTTASTRNSLTADDDAYHTTASTTASTADIYRQYWQQHFGYT